VILFSLAFFYPFSYKGRSPIKQKGGGRKMKKKITCLGVLLCFTFSSFAVVQGKEVWPDPEKTITVVVPYSAGGGTDIAIRPVVEEMKTARRWLYPAGQWHTHGVGNDAGINRRI
jgi:hypothetical protein